MRRARCLTGRSAGVIAVDLRILAVMDVPVVRGPAGLIREQGQRVLHLATILSAELLTELCRANGAYFHAFAAGHAVFLVYVGAVRGTGHVRGVV